MALSISADENINIEFYDWPCMLKYMCGFLHKGGALNVITVEYVCDLRAVESQRAETHGVICKEHVYFAF